MQGDQEAGQDRGISVGGSVDTAACAEQGGGLQGLAGPQWLVWVWSTAEVQPWRHLPVPLGIGQLMGLKSPLDLRMLKCTENKEM